jgi:sugar lactone lactonase YvrE
VPAPSSGKGALARSNRSFEYDSPSDQYARFLLEEILPEVGKKYNLASDGNSRGLCGISSGGICAFTAAWQRPAEFTRVLSFVGSFTNLRGGNFYPDVIRKTEPRPLRVFLQDGRNDLNNFAGSWVNANKDMADALEFAGYDYKYVLGDEGHNARHGGAILPDALRWLWRDYPKPVPSFVTPSRQPLMQILDPEERWEQIEGTYGFTEGPAPDDQGNVYFSDIPNSTIYRIAADGKVSVFARDTQHANGLMFGPDGKLYACQGGANRVVAYDRDAKEQVIAEGIEGVNDIAINHEGAIYVSEPPRHQVWYISPQHEKTVVAKDPIVLFPNGVRLTPDQSQLVVADTKGVRLWIYQVHPDGKLANREGFYDAQIEPGQVDDGADGMTFDKVGRLYVCTRIGVQVFDRGGVVIGIINAPQKSKWLANIAFGGEKLDTLYVCNGDHVYRRKTKTSGVLSWQEPIRPATPRR